MPWVEEEEEEDKEGKEGKEGKKEELKLNFKEGSSEIWTCNFWCGSVEC